MDKRLQFLLTAVIGYALLWIFYTLTLKYIFPHFREFALVVYVHVLINAFSKYFLLAAIILGGIILLIQHGKGGSGRAAAYTAAGIMAILFLIAIVFPQSIVGSHEFLLAYARRMTPVFGIAGLIGTAVSLWIGFAGKKHGFKANILIIGCAFAAAAVLFILSLLLNSDALLSTVHGILYPFIAITPCFVKKEDVAPAYAQKAQAPQITTYMFCPNCGATYDMGTKYCSACATELRVTSGVNPNSARSTVSPADAPSASFGILSFFFPIVGFVLWIVWRDLLPQKAKSCGIGALIGVILSILVPVILYSVFAISIFSLL